MDADALDALHQREEPAADFLTQFCAEFGVNLATAMEMQAYYEQHNAITVGGDALRELNSKFRQSVKLLVSYQQQQAAPNELRMSTRAMALSLGFVTAAGAQGAAELGRKLGLDKQTVNKCLNQFIKKQGLEKLPAQRTKDARRKMSAARNGQLKKNHGNTDNGNN